MRKDTGLLRALKPEFQITLYMLCCSSIVEIVEDLPGRLKEKEGLDMDPWSNCNTLVGKGRGLWEMNNNSLPVAL